MLRLLLSLSAAIAACSPSPQEAAMHRPGPPQTIGQKPENGVTSGSQAVDGTLVPTDVDDRERAAQGPILEAVSAAGSPVVEPMPTIAADPPAAASGRRTLSTAFVMVGPDGHLTVELRNGHTIVLRDVMMRAKDYCGVQIVGDVPGKKYCGGYADVAKARPGGAPVQADRSPIIPDPADAAQRPVNHS